MHCESVTTSAGVVQLTDFRNCLLSRARAKINTSKTRKINVRRTGSESRELPGSDVLESVDAAAGNAGGNADG